MKYLIVFVLLFVFIQRFQPQQTLKLSAYQCMLGDWQMNTKNGKLIESWILKNDSTLQGKSFLIKSDGIKILLENIELAYRLNEVYYIPIVENQNNKQLVKFKIVSSSDNMFEAINNAHDYPKRISYQLKNQDTLHAMIDDGADVPVKFSNFYFTR